MSNTQDHKLHDRITKYVLMCSFTLYVTCISMGTFYETNDTKVSIPMFDHGYTCAPNHSCDSKTVYQAFAITSFVFLTVAMIMMLAGDNRCTKYYTIEMCIHCIGVYFGFISMYLLVKAINDEIIKVGSDYINVEVSFSNFTWVYYVSFVMLLIHMIITLKSI